MEKQEGSFELVNSQVTATHKIVNKQDNVIFLSISQLDTVDPDPGLGLSISSGEE